MLINCICFTNCNLGTPIGRGKLDDLLGLLQFLGARPFNEKKWFLTCLLPCHEGVLERIAHLLRNIFWRMTKNDPQVRSQMGIPPQVEKKTFLRFSSIEKHFYEKTLEETICAASSVFKEIPESNRIPRAKDVDALSNHLHRLRAACCHPQVGSHGIGKKRHGGNMMVKSASIACGVLTMDQILDRLIDEARTMAEESQRIYILHTNALACLTKLKIDVDDIISDDDRAIMLKKSAEIYLNALDMVKKNSSPTNAVGEAILTGSTGFQYQKRVVRNGVASLLWRIHIGDEGGESSLPPQSLAVYDTWHRELWSQFDFIGVGKKISSIRVRSLVQSELPNSVSKENVLCSNLVYFPKDCIFQVSNNITGGMFVDVLTFTMSAPFIKESMTNEQEWQQLGNFLTNKSKSWRVVVKNFYNNDHSQHQDTSLLNNPIFLGMEIQLMEPDIASDNLQKMHILYNTSQTLASLQCVSMIEEGDTLSCKTYIKETLLKVERESKTIDNLYMEAARMRHRASELGLVEATRKRVGAMSKISRNCCWWQDMLTMCHLSGDHNLNTSICRYVNIRLNEMFDDPTRKNRRKFPSFTRVNGLIVAIQLRMQENGNFYQKNHHSCISAIQKLSTEPTLIEILENSRCSICRSDWEQTGPTCRFCRLEMNLIKYRNEITEPELNCVFQALAEWLRTNNVINKIIGLKQYNEKAKVFFDFFNATLKELDAAKTKWRSHIDLLGNIDELNQVRCIYELRFMFIDIWTVPTPLCSNLYYFSPLLIFRYSVNNL